MAETAPERGQEATCKERKNTSAEELKKVVFNACSGLMSLCTFHHLKASAKDYKVKAGLSMFTQQHPVSAIIQTLNPHFKSA